jgi:hypothetical protein
MLLPLIVILVASPSVARAISVVPAQTIRVVRVVAGGSPGHLLVFQVAIVMLLLRQPPGHPLVFRVVTVVKLNRRLPVHPPAFRAAIVVEPSRRPLAHPLALVLVRLRRVESRRPRDRLPVSVLGQLQRLLLPSAKRRALALLVPKRARAVAVPRRRLPGLGLSRQVDRATLVVAEVWGRLVAQLPAGLLPALPRPL